MKQAFPLLLILLVGFVAPVRAQVFYEGFESGINGSQFNQEHLFGHWSWKINQSQTGGAVMPYAGSKSATFYRSKYTAYETALVSNTIDLSAGSFVLSFFHIQKEWAGDQNTMRVYLSVNNGASWILLDYLTGNVSDWTLRSYDLNSAATLTSTCKIKFVAANDYGYAIGLDEVKVGNGCDAPGELEVEYATASDARISWKGSASAYNVEYGPAGFSIGGGTRVEGVTRTSLQINGLSELTTYHVYVQSDCGSAWTGPDSITTGTQTFPYFEDFDNAESWITTGDFFWYLENVTQPNGETGYSPVAEFYYESNGDYSNMYSPVLDLRSLSTPVLNFYVAYQSYPSADDRLEILFSTDGGVTFEKGSPAHYYYSRNTKPSLATVPDGTDWFAPAAASEWRHASLDLGSLAGDSMVVIAFRGTSSYGNNLYIDNVKVCEKEQGVETTVSATGTVISGLGIELNFNSISAGGKLKMNRHDSQAYSLAATEFTTNLLGALSGGTLFTPAELEGDKWFNITFDGHDFSAALDYDVTIDLDALGLASAGTLVITKRADESGSWEALETFRIGNKLYAYGLNSFSDFGLGGGGGPLAVEMSSFTGVQQGETVHLNWTTETEVNNSHFIVERSSDGKTFEAIGTVTGAGNSVVFNSYRFIDYDPVAGGAYYRIADVEQSGVVDYSDVIYVAMDGKSITQMSLWPNPAVDVINIRAIVAYRGVGTLDIIGLNGQLVHREVIELVVGPNSVSIDVSNLATGQYQTVISSGDRQETVPFVKR